MGNITKQQSYIDTLLKSGKRLSNIYKEKTIDGIFIWGFDIEGNEVGRVQRTRKEGNESIPYYEYSIPYNAENKKKIKQLAPPNAIFYHKGFDGALRSVVNFDQW